jgi:hypothetical protein
MLEMFEIKLSKLNSRNRNLKIEQTSCVVGRTNLWLAKLVGLALQLQVQMQTS